MKRNENKKSLKKKVLVVSGLALLLGLIGYTGGNTYAKYIESTEVPSSTATVAKWGYVATASNQNIWGPEYKWNDGKTSSTVDGSGNLTVQATNNTLAPGTSGYFTIKISGYAEVLSSIRFDATSLTDVHYGAYNPVKWNVTGTATVGGVDKLANFGADMSTADLVTALDNLSTTTHIAPNVVTDVNLTIAWDWDFDSDNVNDTILGYLSASNGQYIDGTDSGTAPAQDFSTRINLGVVITINQEQK